MYIIYGSCKKRITLNESAIEIHKPQECLDLGNALWDRPLRNCLHLSLHLQFPFSNTIYFCYIAPLVLLSITAVVSLMDPPPRLAVAGMMCFCFVYVVFDLTPGFVYHLGTIYAPDTQTVRLSIPRAVCRTAHQAADSGY